MQKFDTKQIPEGEIPKNIDDLICKICTYILHDPHECENCGTPYCKDCIDEWHKKSSQCPIKCGGTLKIKPAHRFVKKMLGELQINCPNKSCSKIVKLEQVPSHLKICEYSEIKCTNDECKEKLLRKDLSEHLIICKFKVLICEKCNEKIELKGKNLNKQMIDENELMKEHDCLKILSLRVKKLTIDSENLESKNKIFEKEIIELKEKTNLLYCSINYKCDMAHPLVFRANWSCSCSCCGLIKVCVRWECTTCKKKYCLDCIKLLSPNFCPNFHTFFYGNKGNFICDICGAKKTHGGEMSLHDPVCDFDLCENCVVKLFPSKANNYK
jgi:hypothetical protein